MLGSPEWMDEATKIKKNRLERERNQVADANTPVRKNIMKRVTTTFGGAVTMGADNFN